MACYLRCNMATPDIHEFAHVHCRFRLKSGRVVFGVVWEVADHAGRLLHFTSIGEYERARRDLRAPADVVPMQPDEILAAERLQPEGL